MKVKANLRTLVAVRERVTPAKIADAIGGLGETALTNEQRKSLELYLNTWVGPYLDRVIDDHRKARR